MVAWIYGWMDEELRDVKNYFFGVFVFCFLQVMLT